MGLAFEVASSMADGVNGLCALLAWNDAGALAAPPIDAVTLQGTLAALAQAMDEVVHGGRVVGGAPGLGGGARACAPAGGALGGWPSAGALPPEVVALAEGCVRALCGGRAGGRWSGAGGASFAGGRR